MFNLFSCCCSRNRHQQLSSPPSSGVLQGKEVSIQTNNPKNQIAIRPQSPPQVIPPSAPSEKSPLVTSSPSSGPSSYQSLAYLPNSDSEEDLYVSAGESDDESSKRRVE